MDICYISFFGTLPEMNQTIHKHEHNQTVTSCLYPITLKLLTSNASIFSFHYTVNWYKPYGSLWISNKVSSKIICWNCTRGRLWNAAKLRQLMKQVYNVQVSSNYVLITDPYFSITGLSLTHCKILTACSHSCNFLKIFTTYIVSLVY